ncbi:MAG TPA: helicase-associated domain-containing protein [Ktedonobacteraceae bacterium]
MDQSDLDLLQALPTSHLESIVKTRRIPLSVLASNREPPAGTSTSSLSPDVILELAGYLFNPNTVAIIVQELGEFEIAILRELVACGGRTNSRDLALYLTCVGLLTPLKKAGSVVLDSPQTSLPHMPLQPPQYPPAHAHGVFEMALRHLLGLGLVFWSKQTSFAGRDYTSGTLDGVLIVPLAIRAVIQQKRQIDTDLTIEGQSTDIGDGARTLQRMLYLYWSLAASLRDGLPLVHNGLLPRSALRHMVEHMPMQGQKDQVRIESDFPLLLFIRLLLIKLGLLQEKHNTLYAAPAEDFFSLPLVERARRCYHLYLDTPFWNEILYLSEVNVRPGPAPLEPAHEEVVRARQAVVERLRQEQTDVWCDLTAFIAHTKLHVPYLLFPRQFGARAERYSYSSNPYGWDFRLRRGWLTHREGWHMIEGSFIRAVVGGPLYWLGLLELNREENPSVFRISSGAEVIMSTAPLEISQEPWGRLIVQPNFELVLLAPISEALLVKLDRFADRVRLEHIAQYRLTKSSVTRAIPTGLHTQEIQEILEQAAGSEIPQNVSYSLAEWERQARRIELWSNATLLEVDDETLLDALFADQETRKLFQRRLAPRMAQVNAGQLSAVQNLLWQRSYLFQSQLNPSHPLHAATQKTVQIDTPEPRERQWQLHDDGILQPCYPVLNFYLVAEAERFCERDEATSRSKITMISVHRALEEGMTLEYIIHFLQQYCDGGIPAALLIRLKLWGNGYGTQQNIQVERAPLLCLTEEVLHDLEADEELRSLLGPEVEQQSRLIRIDPDNLERVIALLQERGFCIE